MKKVNVESVFGKERLLRRFQMNRRKSQVMKYVPFVFLLPLLLFVNSCSQMRYAMKSSGAGGYYISYTGNRAVLSVAKSSAKIGVIAYSATNNPMTDLPTLRTIMESVLIANGFIVGRDDVYDLLTSMNYQLLFSSANVKPEAQTSVITWFALEKKLVEETGITHLLVISMVDQYKYNISLIDLRSKSVVVSFAINADSQGGWDSFFKPLSSKQWVDYNSDYEGQYYAWGQLANKIVSLLEGRR